MVGRQSLLGLMIQEDVPAAALTDVYGHVRLPTLLHYWPGSSLQFLHATAAAAAARMSCVFSYK